MCPKDRQEPGHEEPGDDGAALGQHSQAEQRGTKYTEKPTASLAGAAPYNSSRPCTPDAGVVGKGLAPRLVATSPPYLAASAMPRDGIWWPRK